MGATLRIERVERLTVDLWDRTVASDAWAMPDQGRAWFHAMSVQGAWTDASRAYVLDDGSHVLLPLVERRLAGCVVAAASPPSGCGFGGLVGARSREPEVVAAVLADIATGPWPSVRIRPAPETASLYRDQAPSDAVIVDRCAHLLDLTAGLDAVFAAMRKSTRRAIRRIEDGSRPASVVHLRGPDVPPEYEQLRTASVQRWAEASGEPRWLARWRDGRSDPIGSLERLGRALGDDLHIWVAHREGVPAAVNVMASGPVAHVARAVMDREVVGPSGLVQYLDWLAIRHAASEGSRALNLGESGTSTALASYKESLGAVPHHYPEVRLERVPVTRADQIARTTVKRVLGVTDAA